MARAAVSHTHLSPDEWVAHPSPSTFSLVASRLGWALESTSCIGLHAAPFERLVPLLSRGARIICLLRDAKAAADLASWLTARGWGAVRLWTLSALGGPREHITEGRADSYAATSAASPLALAIEADGATGLLACLRSSRRSVRARRPDHQATDPRAGAVCAGSAAGREALGHRCRFRIDLGRMGARRRSGDRDRGAGGSRRQHSRQRRGLRPRAQDQHYRGNCARRCFHLLESPTQSSSEAASMRRCSTRSGRLSLPARASSRTA